jgi:hypothetical protein
MVTPKGNLSTEVETLQVSVLPYRCSIAPVCCVCLECCAAELGSSRGTYELPCIHHRQSCIGVWAGTVNDYFVCPRGLLRRLTGAEYRHIRLNRYAQPNTVRERITCKRDGGPYSTNFRKNCHARMIGRAKPTAWPHAHLILILWIYTCGENLMFIPY